MSNAPFACPHCRGAMNLPPNLAGMTVACPHCKQPFQVPALAAPVAPLAPVAQAEPAFEPDDFSVPRPRRSLDAGPGMSRWLWIVIGTVFGGMLIAALVFLPSSGGLKSELNRYRIREIYDRIKQGTPEEDAVKYAEELMAQFPGELKHEETTEEDQILHQFDKGDYKVIFWVNVATNQVTKKKKLGF